MLPVLLRIHRGGLPHLRRARTVAATTPWDREPDEDYRELLLHSVDEVRTLVRELERAAGVRSL